MRRLYALLLATTFLTTPTPAQAEPISTAIGLSALLGAAFGGSALALTIGTAVGGAIVTGALAIGASLLSSALTPDVKPTESQQERSGPEPSRGTTLNVQYGGALPRQASMGLSVTGGHHVYTNVYGSDNNYAQFVFVIGDGLHGNLVRLWYNNKEVELVTPLGGGGIAGQAISEFRGKPQGAEGATADIDHVWVRWFPGTDAQTADSELSANANPGTRWTSSHRGAGVCYISITQRYNEEMGLTGIPDILVEHEGLALYDFRLDSTNGGSGPHVWGTNSTYEPSDNPVIHEYNFRRGIYISGQRILGMNVVPGDLILGMYQAAANICDEDVPLAEGGDELRYRSSTGLSDDRAPSQTLEVLRASMAGFTLERAGQFGPIAGVSQFIYTDLTITDDDLVVGTSAPFSKYRSRSGITTAVHGQFSDPEQRWAAVAFPARENPADDALYGEKLATSIDLTQVTSPSQAQRIAEVARRRSLQLGSGSLTVGPKWIGVQPGDWLPFESTRHGSMDILVTGVTIDTQQHHVTVTYEKIAASVYTWTTAGEVERPAVPIGGVPSAPISSAAGMTATQDTISGTGGASKGAIRFTWTPIFDPTVKRVMFEIRVQGQTEVITFNSSFPASGQALTTNGVMPNVTHEYRHRLETDPIRPTSWSSWLTVAVGDLDWIQNDHVTTGILQNDSATKFSAVVNGSSSVPMDTSFTELASLAITSTGTGRWVIQTYVDFTASSLPFGYGDNITNARDYDFEYEITLDGSTVQTVYMPAIVYAVQDSAILAEDLLLVRLFGTFPGFALSTISAGSHTLRIRVRSRTNQGSATASCSEASILAMEGTKQS